MPDEENPRAAELLKAYAARRREEAGAPFELHPATRKMLQDEAARAFPAKPAPMATSGPRASLIGRFWPQLAFGTAILAVLVLLLVLVENPGRNKGFELSKLPDQPLGALGGGNAAAPAAPAAKETSENRIASRNVSARGESDLARELNAPAAQSAAPLPSTSPERARSAKLEKKVGQVESEPGLQVSKPTSTVAEAPKNDAPGIRGFGERESLARAAAPPEVRLQQEKDRAQEEAASRKPAEKTPLKADKFQVAPRPNTALADSLSVDEKSKQGLVVAQQAQDRDNRDKGRVDSLASGKAAGGVAASALPESEFQWGFVQLDSRARYRQNLLSPPVPKVLTSFQLVRNGDNIRVIDSDGSVYEGSISRGDLRLAEDLEEKRTESLNKRYGLARQPAPAQNMAFLGVEPKPGQPDSSFFFQVTGTNRTLNQAVTFTGQYQPPMPSASTTGLAVTTEPAASLRGANEIGRKIAGNAPVEGQAAAAADKGAASTIIGKAAIGRTTEFEVKAVSRGQ